jgi:hypothetical protein
MHDLLRRKDVNQITPHFWFDKEAKAALQRAYEGEVTNVSA